MRAVRRGLSGWGFQLQARFGIQPVKYVAEQEEEKAAVGGAATADQVPRRAENAPGAVVNGRNISIYLSNPEGFNKYKKNIAYTGYGNKL